MNRTELCSSEGEILDEWEEAEKEFRVNCFSNVAKFRQERHEAYGCGESGGRVRSCRVEQKVADQSCSSPLSDTGSVTSANVTEDHIVLPEEEMKSASGSNGSASHSSSPRIRNSKTRKSYPLADYKHLNNRQGQIWVPVPFIGYCPCLYYSNPYPMNAIGAEQRKTLQSVSRSTQTGSELRNSANHVEHKNLFKVVASNCFSHYKDLRQYHTTNNKESDEFGSSESLDYIEELSDPDMEGIIQATNKKVIPSHKAYSTADFSTHNATCSDYTQKEWIEDGKGPINDAGKTVRVEVRKDREGGAKKKTGEMFVAGAKETAEEMLLSEVFKIKRKKLVERLEREKQQFRKLSKASDKKDVSVKKLEAKKSKVKNVVVAISKRDPSPELLERLSRGSKARITKQEMHKMARKSYELLPEVRRRKELEQKKLEQKIRLDRAQKFKKVIPSSLLNIEKNKAD
eukprot:TRINITY_DN8772_c0_g1_i3.p1 TRINITY_DN8772_c0_g1~~TRINITY_DN8772_c0_g1_i3.p1  ORF type:complete len:458 (+),score=48.21 TRINITY_DN8772_c0_g1_i3:133-1506(+)